MFIFIFVCLYEDEHRHQRWAPALFSREARSHKKSAKARGKKSESAERERKKREFALFPPIIVEIRFQSPMPLDRGKARVLSKMYSSVGMLKGQWREIFVLWFFISPIWAHVYFTKLFSTSVSNSPSYSNSKCVPHRTVPLILRKLERFRINCWTTVYCNGKSEDFLFKFQIIGGPFFCLILANPMPKEHKKSHEVCLCLGDQYSPKTFSTWITIANVRGVGRKKKSVVRNHMRLTLQRLIFHY